MSTNEELIAEARDWIGLERGLPVTRYVRRLADALEQTTHELKEAWRVAAEQTRLERGRAEQAEATLTKVRAYTAADEAPADWGVGERNIRRILDESVPRPAPTELTLEEYGETLARIAGAGMEPMPKPAEAPAPIEAGERLISAICLMAEEPDGQAEDVLSNIVLVIADYWGYSLTDEEHDHAQQLVAEHLEGGHDA